MSTPKITLIHKNFSTTVGNIPWIRNRLLNTFNIEPFDPDATYDPATHIMVIDRYDNRDSGWHLAFVKRGFKLIVEYFWDTDKGQRPSTHDGVLKLCAPEWIWIDDYLMSQHHGREQRVQSGNPDKFFLLLINLIRHTRDQLVAQVEPYLSDSLHSYRGRGIELAGDYLHHNDPTFVNQNFSNHNWYNSTNFSLVSESLPAGPESQDLYVSEKTFKPIKLNHPFIVHGSTGTLRYLHSLGFETFDHVIDESYDHIADADLRLKKIAEVLDTLYKEFKPGKRLFGDMESLNKIQHNFARFHDESIINHLWQTQILDVIQEFADA
jgi:hypothetical protein